MSAEAFNAGSTLGTDNEAQVNSPDGFTSEFNDADGFAINYLMADNDTRKKMAYNDESLTTDEWKRITSRVVAIRKRALTAVNALRAAGLDRPLSIGMLADEWQTVSDIGQAEVAMDPADSTRMEDPAYGTDGAALPIVHKDWEIGWRRLQASRRNGGGLNAVVAAQMSRAVSEKQEQLIFRGAPHINYKGYSTEGLITHDNRLTYTGSDWSSGTSESETAKFIRDDFLALFERLEDAKFTDGNYLAFLSRPQAQQLRAAVATLASGDTSDMNMRERLNTEFETELGGIYSIETDYLPAGNAVVLQPSPDVMNVGIAENVQPVRWSSNAGFVNKIKFMSSMNVEVYADASGQAGVVHATGL